MSTGDPHVQAFNGEWWDCHAVGKVLLYEHATSGLRVVAEQKAMNKWTEGTVTGALYVESDKVDSVKIDNSGVYVADAKVEASATESAYKGITLNTQPDGRGGIMYRVGVKDTGIVVLTQPWKSNENVYYNIYVNVPQSLSSAYEDERGVCVTNQYCCPVTDGPTPIFPRDDSSSSTGPAESEQPAPVETSTGSYQPEPTPVEPKPEEPSNPDQNDDQWTGEVTKQAAERSCYALSVNQKTGKIDKKNPAYVACLYDSRVLDDDKTAAATLIDAVSWHQEEATPGSCSADAQAQIDNTLKTTSLLCSSCNTVDSCTKAIEAYQAQVGAHVSCVAGQQARATYEQAVADAKKCEKVYDKPTVSTFQGAAVSTRELCFSLYAVLCFFAAAMRLL
jgi:hypothetical protein